MDSIDNLCRFTRFAHFSQSSPGEKSAVHAAFTVGRRFMHARALKIRGGACKCVACVPVHA